MHRLLLFYHTHSSRSSIGLLFSLLLLLLLLLRACGSRAGTARLEDGKTLASYDSRSRPRETTLANIFDDDDDEIESECISDAFFSIFNQQSDDDDEDRRRRRRRKFKGRAAGEDIFCEHLVQAKDKDALKCLVAVNAVACRLERSKVKSRLGKCKKRFNFREAGGCERCALKRVGSNDDERDTNNFDKKGRMKRMFNFLFYDDDDDDDDDENNVNEMDENEKDADEDKTTHFFSVTKEAELHMYFTALSRVESECAQHEQRFRALRASKELSEFFKRIEMSELEAKASVEKSMARLRSMELEIKSSVHETLLETQSVHNQTRESLNTTLTRVQEAQNAVDKLILFAKVHSVRLKELANTFNRTRDVLSKSSLVFFFFVWWFVFGVPFVPDAFKTFFRESLRQTFGAILFSHAIEIALVPRFAEFYFHQRNGIGTAEEEEEDVDIELLIAHATQIVRMTVATTVFVRSIRTTILRSSRERARALEQEAFASSLRRVETDVRTLLEQQRREREEEERRRIRVGRGEDETAIKALLPSERREEEFTETTITSRRSSQRLREKKRVLSTFETIEDSEEEEEEVEKNIVSNNRRKVCSKKRKKGAR
jgi:hypothetical protein